MEHVYHLRGACLAAIVCLFCASLPAQSVSSQVQIENLILSNAGDLSVSAQDQLKNSLEGRTFGRNELGEISDKVKDVYQQEGFFQVKIGEQQVTDLGGEPLHHVSVTVPIASEGRRYYLATITFKGNKEFTSDQLRNSFQMNDGDIFDSAKIRSGLDAMRVVYNERGFINFTPVPDTQVNESRGTVSLVVDMDEGKQFVYGKFGTFYNVPPTIAQKVRAFWQQHQGQTFRPDEWNSFVNTLLSSEKNLPDCSNTRLRADSEPDTRTGTVSADISFVAKGCR